MHARRATVVRDRNVAATGVSHADHQSPHNRVRTVRHICRLQEPNRDALVLYARFIGDTADYVLNQLIETTIAKDRDFVAWRAEQPEPGRRGRLGARRVRRAERRRGASRAERRAMRRAGRVPRSCSASRWPRVVGALGSTRGRCRATTRSSG